MEKTDELLREDSEAAIFDEVGDLELPARILGEGERLGLHRSRARGASVDFAQHRPYTPGDDLRYVDWKMYARSDRVAMKQFEEDKQLDCQILLDASESMAYRSEDAPCTKWRYARLLTAGLGMVALRQQDAVGCMVASPKGTRTFRAQAARGAFMEVLQVLRAHPAAGKIPLAPWIRATIPALDRTSIVLLFSDFFDAPEEIVPGLTLLKARGHDVRPVQILDPAELSFPFEGYTEFEGLEGWENQWGDARALRKAYLGEFHKHQQRLESGLRERGIMLTTLTTNVRPSVALRQVIQNEGSVSE